jgi:hypothetical protein
MWSDLLSKIELFLGLCQTDINYHETQDHDIQQNKTQHNDSHSINRRYWGPDIECCYAECCHAVYRYGKCRYAGCQGTKMTQTNTECCYADCCHA